MGGAYGHMNHPFNLDIIQNGTQLVDFFLKDVVQSIEERPAALKLDGVNTSLKVVDRDGMKEFAGDRGSGFEIDVSGITSDRVEERWIPNKTKITQIFHLRREEAIEEWKELQAASRTREESFQNLGSYLTERDLHDLEKFIKQFVPQHGMVEAYKTVLDIFNGSIRLIKPELEQLGMWNNPTRFFNAEFVEITDEVKNANVVEYDNSYIALHSLAQFYAKKGTGREDKSGRAGFEGVDRAGLPRPQGVDKSVKGTPVPYNQKVLDRLVEKMKPVAAKYGFQIYSSIPTRHKEGRGGEDLQKRLAEVLDQDLSLQIEADKSPITQSLRQWLSKARNPIGVPPQGIRVVTKEGAIEPFNKDVYLYGMSGRPLYELLKGGPDQDLMVTYPGDSKAVPAVQTFVDAIVFWEAIKNLGNVLKQSLTSDEFGDVDNQEGIVIRDKKFGTVSVTDPESGETFEMPLDVKVTGDFIVQGLDTKFGDASRKVNEVLEADPMGGEFSSAPPMRPRVAVFPGSFKPPHRGHLALVQKLANKVGLDGEVIILVSQPKEARDGVTVSPELAEEVWKEMLQSAGLSDKVSVHKSESPSSVGAAIDFIRDPPPRGAPDGAVVYFGCGEKGDDVSRLENLQAYKRPDIELVALACSLDAKHSEEYLRILGLQDIPGIKKIRAALPSMQENSDKDPGDFHASDFRELLKIAAVPLDPADPSSGTLQRRAKGLLRDFVTEEVDIDSLIASVSNVKTENKKKVLSMPSLFSLVEEVLQEISACAGGAVQGSMGGAAFPKPGFIKPVGKAYQHLNNVPFKRDKKKKKKRVKK